MSDAIFRKNIQSIELRFPSLSAAISRIISDKPFYTVKLSKTGLPVPVDADGTAFNSLYDPEKEARQFIDQISGSDFVLFAGIGGAYHIREFLRRNAKAACAVCESSVEEFTSLLQILDLSDIFADQRVKLVSICTEPSLPERLSALYLPVIHGNFTLMPLKSWQVRHGGEYSILGESVKKLIERISADYSVQAHFGRIWLRNFLQNLALLSEAQGKLPDFDRSKIAVIAAAGPGLETSLPELRKERSRFVIFSTDTAFSTLADSGITPDVFVSIDAQSVSVNHVMHPLDSAMTVIMDLCGNPGIARQARKHGCNLIFTAGGHPLERYAAAYSPLPGIDTSSGTVTVAALDAAKACGFNTIRLCGADFAYVHGKPYARGTYLDATFGKASSRLNPAESLYDALMFRTPVKPITDGALLTYRTDVMDRYALYLANYHQENEWSAPLFTPFPVSSFVAEYKSELERIILEGNLDEPLLVTLYPFMAWHDANRAHDTRQAIQLASHLIAGYTEVS